MVSFRSVQCHPGLTYMILNFWHSGILALSPAEPQNARMSDIKNVGYTWMAKCNQLISLPFKGLNHVPDANVPLTSSASAHGAINHFCSDDDDEIGYFTVCWKTRASFVYRTKNIR